MQPICKRQVLEDVDQQLGRQGQNPGHAAAHHHSVCTAAHILLAAGLTLGRCVVRAASNSVVSVAEVGSGSSHFFYCLRRFCWRSFLKDLKWRNSMLATSYLQMNAHHACSLLQYELNCMYLLYVVR
jgi:hypothetical protein